MWDCIKYMNINASGKDQYSINKQDSRIQVNVVLV